MLIDDTGDESNPVNIAIKKFKHHPSIIDIKKNVEVVDKFSFWEVGVEEMAREINKLDGKKSGPFMDIPVKLLKEAVDIVAAPLTEIWVKEIVRGRTFAGKLKLGDVTPLHKKLENIF